MTNEFTIAVHALVYLNHKGCSIASGELAKNICTNAACIRKVLAKLKKAGLVATKEGIDGGYLFTGNPDEVTLADVSAALDQQFVSPGWHSGDADMPCLIASGMAGIMDSVYARLDECCRQSLNTVTIASIDQKIFQNKKQKEKAIL